MTAPTIDTLRKDHAEATARRDLHAMMDVQGEANARLAEDAAATLARGFLPVFVSKRGLYQVVHPSTRQPGQFQITTYNATGALGDTTIASLDRLHGEVNYLLCRLLPDAEVEPTLTRLAAAETQYQNDRRARRASAGPSP